MRITNTSDVSLSLAVWLINDEYDYIDMPNYISVTTLMKPLKQIILAQRVPPEKQKPDVTDFIARGLGNAIHAGIENAWTNNYRRNLSLLGIPDQVIDRIKINPEDSELAPDTIPIYMEQRGYREFEGYTVGGKFDLVAEGHVEDNKSTSAFGWLYGTRDDENILQGSLYRWIDSQREIPRITEDFIRINYIFTDWQKASARSNPKYPQKRVEHKDLKLLPLDEVDNFVKAKLNQIQKYKNVSEDQMPECTKEELWMSDPAYKYYADPTKTAKATKNFTSLREANEFMASKGGKGIVKTFPGEAKRCGYCPAFEVCKQKDRYIQ